MPSRINLKFDTDITDLAGFYDSGDFLIMMARAPRDGNYCGNIGKEKIKERFYKEGELFELAPKGIPK